MVHSRAVAAAVLGSWVMVAPTVSADFADSGGGQFDLVTLDDAGSTSSAPALSNNDCWEAAPATAKVLCASPVPEHGPAGVRLVATSGPVNERVIAPYETFDITATAPADYIATTGAFTIEVGETASPRLYIDIVDDAVVEDTETMGLRITPIDHPTFTLEHDHVVFTIVDNDRDSARIDLSASPSRVDEADGATDIEVTATLDGTVLADATAVTVSVADSGYESAVDYLPDPIPNFTITIPVNARSGSATFTLTPTNDDRFELDEILDLTGTASNGLPVTPTDVEVVDDEELRPAIDDVSGAEDSGELVFTVTLGAAAPIPVGIDFSTTADTARFGEDYEPATGTLSFAAGQSSQTIGVELVDDLRHEDDEQFYLRLFLIESDEFFSLLDVAGIGTIIDNDAPPVVSVGAAQAEEGQDLRFDVTLDAPSGLPAQVDYTTSDGTAVSEGEEADYRRRSATLVFAAGEVSKLVTVTTVDDERPEGNETLTLRLGSPRDASVSSSAGEAQGTIIDDDSTNLSVGDATAREDAGMLRFPVTLTPASTKPITVDYETADGSAIEDEDYRARSGTLSFPAGETEMTITVPLVNDERHEPREYFALTLANPGDANLADGSAIGRIEDDDPPPVFAVANVSVDEGAGILAFVVALPGNAADAEVAYATSDRTAVDGRDYRSASGKLDFPAGMTARTVSVVVIDDDLDEVDETLTLTLSDAENATLPAAPATGTIRDDDLPTATVRAVRPTITEGAPASFEILIAGVAPPTGGVDVRLRQQGDFLISGPADLNIRFGPGATTALWTAATEDDARDEPDGAATMLLMSDDGYRIGTPQRATVTVLDDDRRAVRIHPTALAVEEGGGSSYGIVLATEPSGTVTVTPAVPGDPDLSLSPATVTFGPADWRVEQRIAVSAAEDADAASDPPVIVTHAVAGADYDGEPADSVTVTIVENDTAAFWVNNAAAREADGELRFEVSLSLVANEALIVDYATSDGTARAGFDYGHVSGTLTFEPGETSKPVAVPLLDDAVHEDDETLEMTLSNAQGADVARGTATGTIEDDDGLPTVAINDASADESDDGMWFTVAMVGTADRPVTVDYATTDATAVSGEDYSAGSGSLTFSVGVRAMSLYVEILDDTVHEGDESFRVTLSNPAGVSIDVGTGTGTIIDNDRSRALAVGDAEALENTGRIAFEVSLDVTGEAPVTVDYATAEGSASEGSDFAAASGTLTLAPGEGVATITVDLVDDDIHEADETFRIGLANPVGATIARRTGTGTILDDDPLPRITVGDAVGDESVGELIFDIAMEGESDRPATVDLATADASAIAVQDYRSLAGTLTFAPGERSKSVVVVVLDDTLPESVETFELGLSNAVGSVIARVTGIGTIQDDDLYPPERARPMDDIVMPVGTTRAVDLTPHFVGDPTSYTLQASNEAVGLTVDGHVLTVHGLAVGVAEVTVTAINEAGEAVQTFTVTVVAPPVAIRALADLVLCVDGDARTVDLAAHFGGTSLAYSASSSDPQTASVELDGTVLTVAPQSKGGATVTVTATNVLGEANGSFAVTVVEDEAALAAAEAALAAVARNMLASVGDALAARFEGTRRSSHPVAQDTAYRNPVWRFATPSGPGGHADSGRGMDSLPGTYRGTASPGHARPGGRPSPLRLSLAANGAGTGMGFWVRGDWRRFRGNDGGHRQDGTLDSLHLGVDSTLGDGLIGISASRMVAEVDYRFERPSPACGPISDEGVLTTELASVQPYASWPVGNGVMWAVVGAGRGETSVCRCESERRIETDLDMSMAILGGRWPLGRGGPGRIAWSLLEDIGVLRLTTDEGDSPLAGRDVDASRIRVGIEAQGGVGAVRPFLKAMARHDGGNGDTGTGLELAGGLRYQHPFRRLSLSAEGRGLALHSADARREFGVALTLAVPPCRDLTGLSVAVESTFGADTRLSPMWRDPSLQGAVARTTRPRTWTVAGRLGYGKRVPVGVATPFLELNAGSTGTRAALGARYNFAVGRDLVDVVLVGGTEDRFGKVGTFIRIDAALRF